MIFTLKSFFVFIFLFIASYYVFPQKLWRTIVLPLFNIIFLCLLIPFQQMGAIALFLSVGFLIIKIAEQKRKKYFIAGGIGALLFLFLYLKHYAFLFFLPGLPVSYQTIGLSYLLFRIMQLIIDVHDQQIQRKISLSLFFNYTCYPLSYISGPIQSFQDFERELSKNKKDVFANLVVFDHTNRLTTGYLKIILISPFFFFYHQFFSPEQTPLAWPTVSYFLSAFFFFLYLYFNFAGYMDVILSLSALVGINLPENFNQPFQSLSFLEFWTRWHMTLSNWLKFYVFNPLMKNFMTLNTAPQQTTIFGLLAYFMTFLLIGLWHGSMSISVVFGILLALGACANKLYETAFRKRLGKVRYNALHQNPVYRYFTNGLTLSYMTICISCLFLDIQKFSMTVKALSWDGFFFVLVGGGLVIAVGKYLLDNFVLFFKNIHQKSFLRFLPFQQQLYLAVQILLVGLVLFVSAYDVPKFVYQMF